MSNRLKSRRILSVYEKQQLFKYNLSEEELISNGEMPVEYLTSRVDFAGLTLKVNKHVLIPRVETEELIDHALVFLKNCRQKKLRVLDLATGSGAIALALINQLRLVNYLDKKWDFYLSDLSTEAIALAKNNYQELLFKIIKTDELKVNFVISNLLNKLQADLQFDLVLANLPYIPSRQLITLNNSVKNFEPLMTLDGGTTGFELIAEALEQLLAKDLLTNNALLIFETDASHDYQFVKNYYPDLFKKFKINFQA